jgi:hypothetical protein
MHDCGPVLYAESVPRASKGSLKQGIAISHAKAAISVLAAARILGAVKAPRSPFFEFYMS